MKIRIYLSNIINNNRIDLFSIIMKMNNNKNNWLISYENKKWIIILILTYFI